MNNIEELGKEGEDKVRRYLIKNGYDAIQSPDWLAHKWLSKDKGEWTIFEVKRKKRFEPPPFEGHGLNISQINLRMRFYKDTGVRTKLIIYEVGTNELYGNYLDILESLPPEKKFATQNKIRIYPLENFKKLSEEK